MSGRLKAQRIGTKHIIEERDLEEFLEDEQLPLPAAWARMPDGRPAPNVVRAIRLSRPLTYGMMGGMEKTTVYLTAGQKQALARAAAVSGRSEADLIREGVETVAAKHQVAEPSLPLFESGQPDLATRVDEHLTGFGER